MLERHGLAENPVITGKSVHNQRIERLWVDVFIYVAQYWRNVFLYLEAECGLDPTNEMHLYALHYVYLPRINNMIEEFQAFWNNHSLRTENNKTPLQLWTEGFYQLTTSRQEADLLDFTENIALYGIDPDGPDPALQTNNNVQVPAVNIALAEEDEEYVVSNFNPLYNDGNHGINIFLDLLNFLIE